MKENPFILSFDDHSAEVAEYFEPIFGSEGYDFNEKLLETVGYDVTSSNILILDRLEILPPKSCN